MMERLRRRSVRIQLASYSMSANSKYEYGETNLVLGFVEACHSSSEEAARFASSSVKFCQHSFQARRYCRDLRSKSTRATPAPLATNPLAMTKPKPRAPPVIITVLS